MFLRVVPIVCLTTLAACGGASTSNVVPLSDAGFAAPDRIIATGDSFKLTDTPRVIGDDGTLSLASQDLILNILEGDTPSVEAIIDGQTYILPFVGDGTYELIAPDTFVQAFRQGTPLGHAEMIEIFAVIGDDLNTSQVVIGFDTDPAEVASRRGTASMTGEVVLTARNGFDDGFGTGSVVLDVDFADRLISGEVNVTNEDSFGSDFAIPDATFAMDQTRITGNGFAGTIRLTSGDLGGTLSEATYQGRFFGADAQTAGGEFVGVLNVPDLDQPTFINGAFLATE